MGNIFCQSAISMLKAIKDNSIDAIITDPPYGLKFKGNKWDYTIPSCEEFKEMLRVSKPGATMLCFGGTRTFHRMAVNIEDAGWYINDCIGWLYTSGFPKSVDISYVIDKKFNTFGDVCDIKTVGNPMSSNGKKREIKITKPGSDLSRKWYGWLTGLKPSWEPIIVANKHIEGNYEDNAIKYGVAGYNIDDCRIGDGKFGIERRKGGRYPSNIIIDENYMEKLNSDNNGMNFGEFFYCPKPTKKEKSTYNTHDTVKPLDLMKYLVRLTKTPFKSIVLDPYCGSGTTALACIEEDVDFIVNDIDKKYIDITKRRIEELYESKNSIFEYYK